MHTLLVLYDPPTSSLGTEIQSNVNIFFPYLGFCFKKNKQKNNLLRKLTHKRPWTLFIKTEAHKVKVA